MEVESLLIETRKILKECSRLTKQIASDPTSRLLDILNSEIAKGELLEHQLFQLCAKEGVSLNQLQLLGHRITFSQWRRNNHLHHHDPITPTLGTSRESSTFPVISNGSLTNPNMGTSEKPPILPVTPTEIPTLTMVPEPPMLPVIRRESITLSDPNPSYTGGTTRHERPDALVAAETPPEVIQTKTTITSITYHTQ